MVEFKKLVQKKSEVNPADLIKLFESLDRHSSHTVLRPVQIEALQELGKRRDERDHVLKISTGAGKTTVALLYLQAYMEEKEEPVVYLCPTVQLVEQVLEEAVKLGLKAVNYPKGEAHPPSEGTTAKAIIVCTYAKLFNALTTFDRTDVQLRPCAIVLDDAHAGVEEARDSFSLRINSGDDIYSSLIKLFEPSLEKYHPGAWQSILNGNPFESLEIPFWIWKPLVADVLKIIGAKSSEVPLIFVWPFLRDILRWCRCVVSGVGIELVPDILPVEKISAFFEATHRLFMSATLADDSVLIRELGCDISAASNPIVLASDRGLGERMVLAPMLVSKTLNREWVMDLCSRISKRNKVVVLSPSQSGARDWEKYSATVVMGDDVSNAVSQLKQSTGGEFIVFVQRYDGVDLPDNACRVLVIDGMPYGEGIIDKHDSERSAVTGGVRNRLIYRIEQGMGRAVRSHADYAVVILAGPDLANFVSRKEIQDSMSIDTKAQLKLALELTELAKSEEADESKRAETLTDMIRKSLARDNGWKQFYDERVRNKDKVTAAKSNSSSLNVADSERKAWKLILSNKFNEAVDLLRNSIDENAITGKEQGWFLQRVANYQYEVNPGKAIETQSFAYEKNNTLFCPPPVIKRPASIDKLESPAIVLQWLEEFENPNGAVAALLKLRGELSFEGNVSIFEKALKELAPLVGAKGLRPEKDMGEGPDVLWLWNNIALVIEAKTEKKTSLHKTDAGQLLHSIEWFKTKYGVEHFKPIPITVAKVLKVDKGVAYPDDMRIITPETLGKLLENIDGFIQALINDGPLFQNLKKITKLLLEFHLTPEEFLGKYTLKPGEK